VNGNGNGHFGHAPEPTIAELTASPTPARAAEETD
jgi:hypothetical protein